MPTDQYNNLQNISFSTIEALHPWIYHLQLWQIPHDPRSLCTLAEAQMVSCPEMLMGRSKLTEESGECN